VMWASSHPGRVTTVRTRAWLNVAVCRSAACFTMTRSAMSEAGPTAYPTRNPGLRILENEPRVITRSEQRASGVGVDPPHRNSP
jgi:hypothetical protein